MAEAAALDNRLQVGETCDLMSARRAFVLGAIVGAGALAAVGAVSAGSSSPSSPTDRAPSGLLDELTKLDGYIENGLKAAEAGNHREAESAATDVRQLKDKIRKEYFNQSVNGGKFGTAILEFDCIDVEIAKIRHDLAHKRDTHDSDFKHAEDCKQRLAEDFFQQPVYGVKASDIIKALDCIDARVFFLADLTPADFKTAKGCKQTLERRFKAVPAPPPPAEKVSIFEFDTWAHNTDIDKTNFCINVKTTPPQASISASVTGPGNFSANLPITPLHPDGTRQIGATITLKGPYTDTLIVYDVSGKQTATTTNTFTVKAPPQDGPPPTFGLPCEKPAK